MKLPPSNSLRTCQELDCSKKVLGPVLGRSDGGFGRMSKDTRVSASPNDVLQVYAVVRVIVWCSRRPPRRRVDTRALTEVNGVYTMRMRCWERYSLIITPANQ